MFEFCCNLVWIVVLECKFKFDSWSMASPLAEESQSLGDPQKKDEEDEKKEESEKNRNIQKNPSQKSQVQKKPAMKVKRHKW